MKSIPPEVDNNTDIYTWSPPSFFMGTTLNEPMHSLQHNSSSDIQSRMLMSVLRSATSSSHPSGISPSKNGNSTGLTKASACNGSVRLTGCASSRARYAPSYQKRYSPPSSVRMPAKMSLRYISACLIAWVLPLVRS